jgi:hypothetical protein
MPSLKELNKVDWSQLQHACGSAQDVPRHLLELKSGDEDTRADAINELRNTIWHQGNIYEATSYAVPFLIELLEDKSVSGKEEILRLLELIRTGRTAHVLAAPESNSKQSPGIDSETSAELTWMKSACAAIEHGKSVYLELLKEKNPNSRAACGQLLRCLEPDAAISATLVAAAANEPDDDVCVILIETLAAISPGDSASLELYQNLIDSTTAGPLSKFAAATSLALQGGLLKISDALADVLVQAITKPSMSSSSDELNEKKPANPLLVKILSRVPAPMAKTIAGRLLEKYHSNPKPHLSLSILRPLVSFPTSYQEKIGKEEAPADDVDAIVTDDLLPTLADSHWIAAMEISRVLLHFAFGSSGWTAGQQLNKRQTAVLKAIATNDQVWTLDHKTARILQQFGLPGDRESLRIAIGD